MNDTAKICREISDSADMGKLALSRLIKRCRDASFCSVMADMFANYHELYSDAQELMRELGRHDSGASPRQTKPMLIGLALNTAIDSTPSHLSEMLVQGCAMSLINIARAENECVRADAKAMCLCKRARRNEQENIQRLLKFV